LLGEWIGINLIGYGKESKSFIAATTDRAWRSFAHIRENSRGLCDFGHSVSCDRKLWFVSFPDYGVIA
jgi:sarcosine oxidase delta subunit